MEATINIDPPSTPTMQIPTTCANGTVQYHRGRALAVRYCVGTFPNPPRPYTYDIHRMTPKRSVSADRIPIGRYEIGCTTHEQYWKEYTDSLGELYLGTFPISTSMQHHRSEVKEATKTLELLKTPMPTERELRTIVEAIDSVTERSRMNEGH